ncbi:MAG: flippase [Flavobacteriaceae bacterium]|nr:flippase [Flavobacteriaceae bacterium]
MIKKYFFKYINNLDEHTLEVVKKSSSSLVVKILGMIASFLLSIFLGRTLGAEGLGVINLANSLTNILLIIGLLGTQQIIVKEVAIGLSKKKSRHIGSVMKSAYVLSGGFTLIISFILIVLTPYFVDFFFDDIRLKWPITIGILVTTPKVFSMIWSSALIGYRKIWQSNLVDKSLSVVFTSIILMFLWFNGVKITIFNTAIAYGAGQVLVTIVIGIYWNRLKPKQNKLLATPFKLFKSSFPLLISSISYILISNTDIILLGIFLEAKEVGLYTVASRIALLSSFLLQITNASLSGNIASLYSQNRKEELQRMVGKVTRYLVFLGVIPLCLFFFFGEEILSIWGKEFVESYWILIIIAIGKFFNISSGPAGQLLIMCGFHKIQSQIISVFMIVNFILNTILIYFYGVIGAALGTAIVMAGVSLTEIVIAKLKTGILTIKFK